MKTPHFLFVSACAVAALIGISAAPAQQQTLPARQAEIDSPPQLASPQSPAVNPAPARLPKRAGKPGKRFESLESMQDEYFSLFRSKPGFGASRILTFPPQDEVTLDSYTYQFTSPDLIGLEDEPLAYRRRIEMITMAELTNRTSRASLQRRPLTAEETRAVAELREGKNMVVLPIPMGIVTPQGTNEVTGLLAVGALRARTECAQCHQCKEGTLLGAFSYQLVPKNVAPPILLSQARNRR